MPLTERANAGLHAHIAEVVAQSELPRDARILDLGCGTGAFLERLRAAGFTCLAGVDISAPEDLHESIEFRALDLDTGQLPFPAGHFDLIVAIEVLEHIENLGMAVSEIGRKLKPSGQCLATTPNVHSVEARLRLLLQGGLKQFDAIGDPTHLTPIFRYPFAQLLARHGLHIARDWGHPADGRSPTSRPLLRALARAAGLVGLRGLPAGDNYCLVIERAPDWAGSPKAGSITAHYGASM
jgi:2-polyprenyl-3-methyl-5-hydroxy-6-metoxy-1,4-benzoquinol methylase